MGRPIGARLVITFFFFKKHWRGQLLQHATLCKLILIIFVNLRSSFSLFFIVK